MRTTPAAPADKGPDFDLELAKFSARQMEAVNLLDHAQEGSLTGKWHFLKLGYGDDTNGFFKLAEDTATLSISPVQALRFFCNIWHEET